MPVALSTLVIRSIALQTQAKQNIFDNLNEGSLHSRNCGSSDFHQGPLHVCLVKKWCRPVNPHANSFSPKCRLNRQRLGAETKKHGYPIGWGALLDQALDGGRNIPSFRLVGAGNVTMNGLGRAPLRLESQSTRATQHDVVGRSHNVLARAIVALQFHHRAPGVALGKIEKIGTGRPGKAINRLAGVPHDHEVFSGPKPHLQQLVLQWRDVLVLIHQKYPVLGSHAIHHPLLCFEHAEGPQQNVFKVDAALLVFHLLVSLMNAGDYLQGQPTGQTLAELRALQAIFLQGVGVDFSPLDVAGEVSHHSRVHRQRELVQGLGNQRSFGGGNIGEPATGDGRPKVLKLAQSSGVKCPGCHTANTESAQALRHF